MPHGLAPRRFLLAFALILAGSSARAQEPLAAQLGAYNADVRQSSISGISSGAFMAVQFAVAWSSVIRGVGAIAGGPYDCAHGTGLDVATGASMVAALTVCMKASPSAPDADGAVARADAFARDGEIDDLANVAGQKVYLFNGYNDTVVDRQVTDTLETFYRHYLGPAHAGNLFYQNALGAGHAQITAAYGGACQATVPDYINQCGYDQAGIILRHIYGALHAPSETLGGRMVAFSQREFTYPFPPASFSMAEVGYAYVPAPCQAGAACRVHIALHGCKQNAAMIGTEFILHAGYNEWADANNIIVLYPQTVPSSFDFTLPFNPDGCWDWWGYTNASYTRKAGRQIGALKAMLDRLAGGTASAASATTVSAPALRDVSQIDASDTAVDLAWSPVAGATAYVVSRASDQGQSLRQIGIATGASFGDAGLSPDHTYHYQITAVVDGGPGPRSPLIAASTKAAPPRCASPGACAMAR